MSSLFGVLFRVATWGESHGGGVGAVVDGCPPRIPLTAEDIQSDLDRRRPGQSEIVTQRAEEDKSGLSLLQGKNGYPSKGIEQNGYRFRSIANWQRENP